MHQWSSKFGGLSPPPAPPPLFTPMISLFSQYTGSEDEGDSDGADNVAIRQENAYYNGKALRETDPQGALQLLTEVVDLEEQKDEWGFRALKQMMKLYFRQV